MSSGNSSSSNNDGESKREREQREREEREQERREQALARKVERSLMEESTTVGNTKMRAISYIDEEGNTQRILQKDVNGKKVGHVTLHPNSTHKHGSFNDDDD